VLETCSDNLFGEWATQIQVPWEKKLYYAKETHGIHMLRIGMETVIFIDAFRNRQGARNIYKNSTLLK
jgi:hypothetical protein